MTNTRIRWYHINGRARCPINFTQPIKRFILSLHNNGSNSFLFVNATKLYQVKVKGSKIKDWKLCLGNVWKDFTIKKIKKKKKNRIKRNCNFFSVDFNPIDTNEILDIHKYLMKEK